MCDARPGDRCAPDTRAAVTTTERTYRDAYPSGPAVGTLERAQFIASFMRHPATTGPDREARAEAAAVRRFGPGPC